MLSLNFDVFDEEELHGLVNRVKTRAAAKILIFLDLKKRDGSGPVRWFIATVYSQE